MKKIALICGSPKIGEDSTSSKLLKMLEENYHEENISTIYINIREATNRKLLEKSFEQIFYLDVLVFAFPLYNFSLPGILTNYLEKLYDFLIKTNRTLTGMKCYCIVNCGFAEPQINEESVRIIQLFCKKTGVNFRFGIKVGTGPVLCKLVKMPPFHKTKKALMHAFSLIVKDTVADNYESPGNQELALNMPPKLYYFLANIIWIVSAKRNKISPKHISSRPYEPSRQIK